MEKQRGEDLPHEQRRKKNEALVRLSIDKELLAEKKRAREESRRRK